MYTVKLFWFVLIFWSAHYMPLGAFLFEQVQFIKKNIILIEKNIYYIDGISATISWLNDQYM